ncbi:MAG: bifunctional phosphopantothenoylcysteine decarboxylase/phosphopantothenate synthase [Acidimicrobiales bacterium]
MSGSPSLAGSSVVLGVSGGIAAYKAVEVCRRLVDSGAHVATVMTPSALKFVGEATFTALSSERAHTSLLDDDDPVPHTRLGKGADLVIVAPATARAIGSYAAGISSDLLTATLLATRAPVLVCPAMHSEMWEHEAVRENIAVLRRRGVHVLEPESGHLAGGDSGSGRLAEPETIVAAAAEILSTGVLHTSPASYPSGLADRATSGLLFGYKGLSVLVTAGGTREPIDPVRFLANRSSGKQGYAIAREAAERGAEVTLVSTVDLQPPAGVRVINVETAAEMAAVVLDEAADHHLVVMAAAVADFRPAAVSASKLRKADGVPEIVLEPTLDILAELGRRRLSGQVLVGFAAETGEVAEAALAKLASKAVDVVVGNDVGEPGAGFSGDTNAVTIVTRDGRLEIPLTSKQAVAGAVLDVAHEQLAGRRPETDEQGAART